MPFVKGYIPWNKGKGDSVETRKKKSESSKKCWTEEKREIYSLRFKMNNPMKIPEIAKKTSISQLGSKNHRFGKTPWNKGKPFMKLENHPLWQGGISFLPYCKKFNRELKEKIRIRDNCICQLCGIIQTNRKHDVHHIHYDKQNCYPDLICLCHDCHVKINHNRKFYEELFMNKLNDRELLFWTRSVIK